MEIIINDARIKYEDGKIWRFGKYKNSIQDKWFELKGTIQIDKDGYKCNKTKFNHKQYITSRLIYKLHNPEWDINNNNCNNTIDHININSLDNRIENLRIATMSQQNVNRKIMKNVKGYWKKTNQKWAACISIDGKRKHLGYFDTEEEASLAYQNAVAKYRIKI